MPLQGNPRQSKACATTVINIFTAKRDTSTIYQSLYPQSKSARQITRSVLRTLVSTCRRRQIRTRHNQQQPQAPTTSPSRGHAHPGRPPRLPRYEFRTGGANTWKTTLDTCPRPIINLPVSLRSLYGLCMREQPTYSLMRSPWPRWTVRLRSSVVTSLTDPCSYTNHPKAEPLTHDHRPGTLRHPGPQVPDAR